MGTLVIRLGGHFGDLAFETGHRVVSRYCDSPPIQDYHLYRVSYVYGLLEVWCSVTQLYVSVTLYSILLYSSNLCDNGDS